MKISVKQWPDGWYLVVHDHGKRVTKKCADQADAEQFKRELDTYVRSQDVAPALAAIRSRKQGGGSATFGDYADRFLEDLDRSEKADRTKTMYRCLLNAYILPFFKNKPVRFVTRVELKEWARALRSMRDKRLSKSSINLTRMLVRHVLAEAVDDELIPRNPAEDLKGKYFTVVPEEEVEPFEEDELEKGILPYFKEHRRFLLILFLARTGARIGEVLAVKWSDIDWFKSQARIFRQAGQGEGTRKTKTPAGRRWVDLSPELYSALKAANRDWKERRMADPRLSELVFADDKGKMLSYFAVRREWNRALEKIGMARRGLHCLRHTFASLMLSRGANLAWLSRQLGHANPGITLRVYSRWVPSVGASRDIVLADPRRGEGKVDTSVGAAVDVSNFR